MPSPFEFYSKLLFSIIIISSILFMVTYLHAKITGWWYGRGQ